MSEHEQIVSIERSGDAPELDIRFGHEHWGKYRAVVWNPSGSNPERVIEGTNVDDVPDRFALGSTSGELDNRILTVEMFAVSYDTRAGDPFTIAVELMQEGHVVDGGSRFFSGNLGEGGIAGRFARFRVKVT